jgi:predicted alpha/beta superfamily hydrolase
LHAQHGHLKIHPKFRSQILKNERDLIVYLPPGYDSSGFRRYPVCYMHDGQNLFDPATAFCGNDWRLQTTTDDLINTGQIPPLIIVGVNNTGETRLLEYTHVAQDSGRGGKAPAYGRALVREVKPLIDQEYRTLTAPECTTLGGSSLGGLVSAYIGVKHPEVFGNLILMSPSVWWAGRDILKRIKAARSAPRPRVWLDIGTQEGSDPDSCVRDVRALRDAFLAKGWQLGRDLMYQEEEGAQHNERAWAQRMGPALRFLYSTSAKFDS